MRPTATLAAILFAMAATASAQWLNYPTSGVPHTPDGKPNLSAPTPRTPDGHPDFSGTWDVLHNRPCPPDGCNDMLVPQEFVNIGWSLKDGLPYTPWAADLVKSRLAAFGKDDPGSHCLPTGIVKMHTTPLFKKVIQVPGVLGVCRDEETDAALLRIGNPARCGMGASVSAGETTRTA